MSRIDKTALTDRETVLMLLAEARAAAWAEHRARHDCEQAIVLLGEYGVSSSTITRTIGHTEDDRPLISKSTIQRLTRDEFQRTPRRRRR